MNRFATVCCAFFLCFAVISGRAEVLLPETVEQFLEQHCYECHDGSVSKGDLNLMDLPFGDAEAHDLQRWVRVFDRVHEGEMPPEEKPRPAAGLKKEFLKSLESPLVALDRTRVEKEGRVKMRRLTRSEYENTVHDLLGIDIPLQDHLPEEPGGHIFETEAQAQQLSHHLLARYLDVAEMALEEAFQRVLEGDKTYSRTIGAKMLGRGSWKGGNYRGPEDRDGRAIAWPIRMQFYGRMPATTVPESGWYRITIEDVHSVNSDVVWGTLKSGACSSSAPMLFSIGNVEATREKRDLVYDAWIQKRHMLELKPADVTIPRAKITTRGGTVKFKGSNLLKDGTQGISFSSIKMERIYPNAPRWQVRQNLIGKWPKEAFAKASEKDKREMIEAAVERFANRAFRRPVSKQQAAPYVQLALVILAEKGSKLEDALFTAYRAILCSPRFLTFHETPGRLDQHALACRLSYMIWNSMPDAPLRKLADNGELTGSVVNEELRRLLGDPRSERFFASFTDQWLNLKEIDFTSPDSRRFRTFDPVVQESLVEETRAFFRELVVSNLPVTNLIHSDFAFLDERLSRFYQFKDLDLEKGAGIQKVSLKSNPRGGLISHGSILKVTADGTTTSPIVRGVYINERILGREIPPPPPGIPAVEPDIRGAVSIRDQLKKHRDDESCAACHRKIDPAGFAMENFDPVGLWRQRYGSSNKSAKVDSSGVTPDGQAFENVIAWKKIYYEKPEMLTRAFARHVLAYATGSEPGFSDRNAIRKIVESAGEKNYGMLSILHSVVASEPFKTK